MAYAVDLAELLRRMADDVHKVLNGAKPGDIPIYQPTKFELLINLETAKALGLTLARIFHQARRTNRTGTYEGEGDDLAKNFIGARPIW